MILDISGIANIFAAVGTLIFLATQIRDNIRIMQTSALGSVLQHAR